MAYTPPRVPNFLALHQGFRENALAHYELLLRCGSTPARAIEDVRKRTEGSRRRFLAMGVRSSFSGRRIGAVTKLLRAIELGQGQLAKRGGA